MRRLAALLSLLTALTGGLVVASSSPATAGDRTPVGFGMSAFGFGAKVKGGQLPVGSGPIARAIVACNNVAGITKDHATAAVDLPGLGKLEGVETKVWTRKKGGTVSTYARHTIADVVLADSGFGKLSLTGVTAWSRAYHDASGFHTDTRTSLLGIKLTPPGGLPPQTFPVPAPGNPITIPGVATIRIGGSTEVHGKHRAIAQATGLRVRLQPTDTTVALARAVARLVDATNGVFGGIAYGARADILQPDQDPIVQVGSTPQVFMPCAGTDNQVLSSSVASVPIPGLDVSVAEVSEKSSATRRRAKGWEQASIAHVDLGGQLQIDGIKARAFVERVRGKKGVIRDTTGTGALTITVQGQPQQIPIDGQPIEIPGLVKIEFNLVKKLKAGLEVTAVRLTLLDGTGAVVNLGVARMRVGQLPVRG